MMVNFSMRWSSIFGHKTIKNSLIELKFSQNDLLNKEYAHKILEKNKMLTSPVRHILSMQLRCMFLCAFKKQITYFFRKYIKIKSEKIRWYHANSPLKIELVRELFV